MFAILLTVERAPRLPSSVEITSSKPINATIKWTLEDTYSSLWPEVFVILYGVISTQLDRSSPETHACQPIKSDILHSSLFAGAGYSVLLQDRVKE